MTVQENRSGIVADSSKIDAKGEDMKRGVLSEDGIFDLLEKYNEMRKG